MFEVCVKCHLKFRERLAVILTQSEGQFITTTYKKEGFILIWFTIFCLSQTSQKSGERIHHNKIGKLCGMHQSGHAGGAEAFRKIMSICLKCPEANLQTWSKHYIPLVDK